MDPLSSLFAAFLDHASAAITHHMLHGMHANPQTVVVEHQGQRVSFQHQLWRVRGRSVCSDRRADIATFARRTQAAHEIFEQACQELRANPQPALNYRPMLNMYCAAAAEFKPTQASIQWTDSASGPTTGEDCRLAQAALIGENTPETRAQRKKACGY
jgi:hypothetical protein